MIKRVLLFGALVLLLAAAAIQMVPVDRTNPPVVSDVDAPAEVKEVLRRACYDCHSNQTDWPWYSHVAPLSWFVADHVRVGRKDLNFSEWPAFDRELQELAKADIREQVAGGTMPLTSYTWLHPEARLTDAEREVIVAWTRR